MGIAQERYFYKISPLTEDKIKFIFKLWIHYQPDIVKKANINWLYLFSTPEIIKKTIPENIAPDINNNFFKTLDLNFEEKLHSMVEGESITILNNLINFNFNYFHDENIFLQLLFFLLTQYFRTKKMQNSINQIFIKNGFSNLQDTWNVTRWIIATTISYNLFVQGECKLIALINESGKNLITSDQPAINIYAGIKPGQELNKDEFELYYPLSPQNAILLTLRKEYNNFQTVNLSEQDISIYNDFILKQSHEQIFAKSRVDLKI